MNVDRDRALGLAERPLEDVARYEVYQAGKTGQQLGVRLYEHEKKGKQAIHTEYTKQMLVVILESTSTVNHD